MGTAFDKYLRHHPRNIFLLSIILVISVLFAILLSGTAYASEAGNPFADGWYADPDMAIYNNRYWVFPTTSRAYNEQTFMDAFSSADLVTWTKHPNVLNIANISWATRALWAPAPIARNGKYYLYFAANDIQNNSQLGGIGVAVANQPQGPYIDALGRPLIAQFVNGAQPIDQDVFIDDDGQAYMYYGGWSHANVVRLNADMISLGQFPDGSTYKEITPSGYVEGSQMFKRNGMYYLMWSEGGWTGPDYAVAYARSSSPIGPFNRIAKVLAQDPAVARGSGHNTVVNLPGTDTWYIFYHRRPLGETDGNHRVLAYDPMYFNTDGTIKPVIMTVRDNFNDNNAIGWRTYGGSWSVSGGQYSVAASAGGRAQLNTDFSSLVYEADVTLTSGSGDGGVVFRVTQPGTGLNSYFGYYAGLRPSGQVVLGKSANNWTQIATAPMTVALNTTYRIKIEAVGSSIKVFVDDMSTPKISVTDTSHTTGANGLRVNNVAARFDNLSIRRPTDPPVGPTATRTRTPSGPTLTPTRTNTPGGPTLTPTRTPTRTPTPATPVGVTFYQDINYGGAASPAFGKGDYAVLPAGVPNDWMSSLRVPAGWIVDAYSNGNFGGTLCTYSADTSWVGTACNDVMSSFRIR